MIFLNWLDQVVTISLMNVRNIPQRLGSSAVAIFGVACVVGVFLGVLSMAAGFERTMLAAGSPDTAVILRAGAVSEMTSGFSYEETQLVTHAEGILQDGDQPISSAELYVVVDIPKRSTDTGANVPLRGVQAGAFLVRDHVEMVEGRRFEEGKNELIVGRSVQKQFLGLEVGSSIKFGQTSWEVVGVFEDRGSVSESELWCDVRALQQAYRRGNSFQTIRVKLENADSLSVLKASLASEPRLNVDVKLEKEYYAEQSEGLSTFIKRVGYPLAFLMALGAIFGAVNTMYASVSERMREIATLRSLGFGAFPVAISTLVESLLLAVIGSFLGSLVVYLIFNGYTVSTINGSSFSQVVFDFVVTPELLIKGFNAAIWIGMLGGLLPAIKAARMPIAAALRES